jgi:carbon monoxide dehydrogenase subunit G
MRVSFDTEVDQPADVVWSSLTNLDSVLAALPGAALARDEDGVSGSLKCKLGAAQVTYRIAARAEVGEAEFRTAVLAITGKEARGSGTIGASLTVAIRNDAPTTRIEVSGDVEATGRGEKADAAAWQRLIELQINALVPPAAPEPQAPEPAPPRPPLVVAPPPPDRSPAHAGRSDTQRQLMFGLAAVIVLILLRRLRRQRS